MVTGYSVDSDFLKRAVYVVHLPYGCGIVFLECDCIDIVSTEVLETFTPAEETKARERL